MRSFDPPVLCAGAAGGAAAQPLGRAERLCRVPLCHYALNE